MKERESASVCVHACVCAHARWVIASYIWTGMDYYFVSVRAHISILRGFLGLFEGLKEF